MNLPNGFRLSGRHCGVKQAKTEDIALITAERPCVAAGVYTQNQVVAAPVLIDRERTPADDIRAVVVNSGNANACTGELGLRNANRMAECTAQAVGTAARQVLVMSTGIIGEQLPMAKIEQGIADCAAELGTSDDHLLAVARAFLTTDTKTKIASNNGAMEGVRIAGIAKGSGMIGPNMATMLSLILTDAALPADTARSLLCGCVESSFNSIDVDGHTSTNDTVLLLASGSGAALAGRELERFEQQLHGVCIDLAKQIVQDGEGATHLIEIKVAGAASDAEAKAIAKTIAASPLVKTAIAGNDPNWGRIVSAAGYAGPPIDVCSMELRLAGTTLFSAGAPVAFAADQLSEQLKAQRDVAIELTVGKGPGTARYWTCDLTHEYVTINAEYHT